VAERGRVADQLAGLTPEQRALALRLRAERVQGSAGSDAARVQPRSPGEERLPLTSAQRRMWFLELVNPGNAAYNVFTAVRMFGELDFAALERAINGIVARHEVLRTTYASAGGWPVQEVLPSVDVPLARVHLEGVAPAAQEEAVRQQAEADACLPFDLVHGPVLRCSLAILGQHHHVLQLAIHHIVADGWSMGILVRELAALYGEYASGGDGSGARLSDLPVQYGDYALWERDWLEGEECAAEAGYWRERLSGAPQVLRLPSDWPRPAVQSMRGAARPVVLPAKLSEAVWALGRREGATPFMVLLAAFSLLLSRWSGQEDILVGAPVANRRRSELEPLIGLFANTLVLRTDLSGEPNVREFLRRVRETALEAYEHQDVPFERLVEELSPERDPSAPPLVQAVFVLQNAPMPALGLGDLTLEQLPVENGTAKFDLTLALHETEGSYRGYVEYSTDLFEAASIDRMIGHYLTLLGEMVAAPERKIGELGMLTPAEREDLLERLGGAREFPVAGSLVERFEEQARRTPGSEAVTFAAEGERHSLSYAELDGRANRLARVLRRCGVGPEVPVAICLPRTEELVVAVLGVLKAGGAYVPLDPANPAERLSYMLRDSGAAALVTLRDWEGKSELDLDGKMPVVCLDGQADEIAAESGEPLGLGIRPEQLAYVIYTSGSTGRPKGVQVEHRQVLQLFAATEELYGFGSDDVWTLFHSYAFDFSVWELWGALLHGGRLVVVPYLVSRTPDAFLRLVSEEGVTVLSQTPSAFRQLMVAEQEQPQELSLRWVIFGGEALDFGSLRPWFERHGDKVPRLVNMYGITETTVHVTWRLVRQEDAEEGRGSLIGEPIPDLRLLLLDQRGQPVPVGVPGEIWVGGAGVVRGYLGRPELTAERFAPCALARDEGGRWYRSGDLARRRPDGELEYLGRIDSQVKIRGFRIELGEIEAALATHPAVRESHVLTDGAPGGQRLMAYVVPDPDAGLTPADLRRHLQEALPDYMLPAAFVLLERLPLTPNGKVDRQALPAPDARARRTGAEYIAPRNPTEEALCRLFGRVLGLDRVGVHDNFFELGGNSLLATQVISRARKFLGAKVGIRQLFEAPTVHTFSELLRRREERPGQVAVAAEVLNRLQGLTPGEVRAALRQKRKERGTR